MSERGYWGTPKGWSPSIMFCLFLDSGGATATGIAWANVAPFKRADEREFVGVPPETIFAYVLALTALYGVPAEDIYHTQSKLAAFNAWREKYLRENGVET